jgi:hypothetical protein
MQQCTGTSEDDITVKEMEALKRFKGIILARGFHYPNRSDDQTLMRFLRARQMDEKKAVAMYGEYVKWRKESNIENMQVCFSEVQMVNRPETTSTCSSTDCQGVG